MPTVLAIVGNGRRPFEVDRVLHNRPNQGN
jgi:hypothetical protein